MVTSTVVRSICVQHNVLESTSETQKNRGMGRMRQTNRNITIMMMVFWFHGFYCGLPISMDITTTSVGCYMDIYICVYILNEFLSSIYTYMSSGDGTTVILPRKLLRSCTLVTDFVKPIYLFPDGSFHITPKSCTTESSRGANSQHLASQNTISTHQKG